jgi:quinohemoprotein ethanol dehydrogenase
MGAVGGGTAPDLRTSSVLISARGFLEIVHNGALVSRGMPKFDELSTDDAESIRQHVGAQSVAIKSAH